MACPFFILIVYLVCICVKVHMFYEKENDYESVYETRHYA